MIGPEENKIIHEHACIPEHLPEYGAAVSGGEPFLAGDFVFYLSADTLIFVGFPLRGKFEEGRMGTELEKTIREHKSYRVTLIAPAIPPRYGTAGPPDSYYRLDLDPFLLPPKVKNMVRRASRDLQVETSGMLDSGHLRLIFEFSQSRPLEDGTRVILSRIPAYLSASPTARVFSARTGSGQLAGFDIAEFAPTRYAFYMFNFRSRQVQIPGASDLLLSEILRAAREEGKRAINLGLGINPGVAFFKEKWGGRPFLEHRFVRYRSRPASFLESLFSER